MRPMQPGDSAIRPGWRIPAARGRAREPRTRLAWEVKAKVAALALAVMAGSLALAWAVERTFFEPDPAPAVRTAGTASLGTTTCADWRGATRQRRLVIVRTLAVAATHPDPENPGATLSDSAAYGLFQRVCSTPAARSTLLYESYNRAASFRAAPGAMVGPTGHP